MATSTCPLVVRLCSALREWPAAVLCTSLAVLQMAILDYYLVHYLGISHLTWLAFDSINLSMLLLSIRQARTAIYKFYRKSINVTGFASGSMGWVAWLFMSISVAAKAVVAFRYFSHHVSDAKDSFFGPNTLKTTIALGSCTFLLLLITQHDVPAGSDGRRYIEDLAGTVVFDILDTVDILEALFDLEVRSALWYGLEEFILAVAVMNLILPTLPLYMLAKSNFGQKKLSINYVHGHRILLVLSVNMPNLLIRIFLWHGLETGVSPFTLKNILAISITFYDIYEHHKEELKKEQEEEGRRSAQLRGRAVSTSSTGQGISPAPAPGILRHSGPNREENKQTGGPETGSRHKKHSLKLQSFSEPSQNLSNDPDREQQDKKTTEGSGRSSLKPVAAVKSSAII